MKYVTFQRLSIKNFLSVGDEPVEINFNTGLNIITGVNKDKSDRRNGVGKSTIADAIYFAIFGSTIRDIKKENICNNITNGQTEVSIEFVVKHDGSSTNYKVVRLLTPSKCYIYKDGVDVTRDSINNSTKNIADLISSSPEVFQNCVIMTINNTIPFMAKKKIEKRKFIEGILNLEVFSDMLSSVRSEYNELLHEFNTECGKYDEASNQIQSIETQQKIQEDENKNRITKLAERKKQNQEQIDLIKEKSKILIDKSISDYQEIIENYKKTLAECNSKYDKLYTKQIDLKNKNRHLQDALDNLGTEKGQCPVCLQPVTDHTKEAIAEEKKSLQAQIDDNKQSWTELGTKLNLAIDLRTSLEASIENNQRKINDQKIKIKEKDSMLSKLNQLEEWNRELVEEAKHIKTQSSAFDNIFNDLTNRLEEIQVVIDSYKKQISLLDIVKFVVSEEGVKSYIVKKILQLLNNKLLYYLKKMDSNCICVFNEYFEEQIIDEKGKVLSYFNFSGAEKKNIDLACLFAFMDIRRLQGDVAYNFNIYDELFDSSLDERGVELVLDILKERIEKYNECIMVISHRKESVKLATNDVIFLEKKNGITTRSTIQEEI